MTFSQELINRVRSAPKSPGCYIYKGQGDKVLYIGKAVNLRSRVLSYFLNYQRLDPKIQQLIPQIKRIEFVTTDSELEALILETNLIKKYKPKYNKLMKDDKNYGWLMFTLRDDFPKILFTREKSYKANEYFGPYTNTMPIKRALRDLRQIFPFRTCNRKITAETDANGKTILYSRDTKPCLFYHLKLCNAPCAKLVSKADYRKNIGNIMRFFRGAKYKIIEELEKDMLKLSENKMYEKAALVRNKIQDLRYLSERIRVEQGIDEKLWVQKQNLDRVNTLKELISKLKIPVLKYCSPFRIECYDISNISGTSATGSMVVFIEGKPLKKHYRKFKIKFKDTPDDYAMLKEVFDRRFGANNKGKDPSFSNLPNLIIVDGGKGQLAAVDKILKLKKISIPLVGLAKRLEEIFKIEETSFKRIILRKGSGESFLIQRIRDEAHRFAIKYHRILRSRAQTFSLLDTIPGVGSLIKRRLLTAFGSFDAVKKASKEELLTVVKNRKTVGNILRLTGGKAT